MVGTALLRKLPGMLLVLGVLATPVGSSAAEPSAAQEIGAGNAQFGKQKVQSENCQECHGLNGVGLAPSAPKLAGQYANYLVKQLQDFQSGARRHPVMTAMAESLSDDDRADIAAWFSSSQPMSGSGAIPSLIARDLFIRGDFNRNILPCKSCHGETGRGQYAETGSYPVIGGQHMIYLREQLRNWRAEIRTNSAGGIMNSIAKALSDEEIEALASYISGM